MFVHHDRRYRGQMEGAVRTPRRLASIPKAAEYIGTPESTIRDWTRRGLIDGIVRVGRRVLLDLDKVDAWIDRGGTAQRDEAA